MARKKKKEPVKLYTQYDLKMMVHKIYKDLSEALQPHLTEESGTILNEQEAYHLEEIYTLAEATAEQINKSLQDKDSEFVDTAVKEFKLDEQGMIDELEAYGHIIIQSPSLPEIYKLDEFLGSMSENPYQLSLI
jgi:hypothetical protein